MVFASRGEVVVPFTWMFAEAKFRRNRRFSSQYPASELARMRCSGSVADLCLSPFPPLLLCADSSAGGGAQIMTWHLHGDCLPFPLFLPKLFSKLDGPSIESTPGVGVGGMVWGSGVRSFELGEDFGVG